MNSISDREQPGGRVFITYKKAGISASGNKFNLNAIIKIGRKDERRKMAGRA